jgi:hypothetical protein
MIGRWFVHFRSSDAEADRVPLKAVQSPDANARIPHLSKHTAATHPGRISARPSQRPGPSLTSPFGMDTAAARHLAKPRLSVQFPPQLFMWNESSVACSCVLALRILSNVNSLMWPVCLHCTGQSEGYVCDFSQKHQQFILE